jgi:peptide deformylase
MFFTEGCLSFPGDSCNIVRPVQISVRYQDHEGSWIYDRLQGLEARCFQHELDHLDGITMWDRHREQNAEQSRD